MINVYIISGFLGAGKTTLIQHLLKGQKLGKVMLLENEFGEIGIDGNLFEEGLQVTEINSGCICCSLKGDLENALNEIMTYDIDTLLIEPSGVGKLSEVINSVSKAKDLLLVSHICIVDAKKALSYHRNYKEFFDDQVKAANSILLSKTEMVNEERLSQDLEMLRELNADATIVTTDYHELSYDQLLDILNENVELGLSCEEEECCCNHEHHHHEEGECCCGHDHEHEHHHHEEGECCGHHHHHDEEECGCGHEHHHHHEEGECCCGHHDHDHDHHHHHHADEVFETYGFETIRTFSREEIEQDLESIRDVAVRAKGIVKGETTWYYFDLTGDDIIVKEGRPSHTGLVTVIGKGLDEEKLKEMFCK